MAVDLKAFKVEKANDWCPGCGDFGALNAVQMALAELDWKPHEVAVFSGIGCSGKTSHYVSSYGIHTLHGRVLAFATGAKLSKPDLKVVAVGGDGDGYGIGACHFMHAGRRNLDLAYFVYTNEVYGLTKGQASPALREGEKTKSLPLPNINANMNALAAALAAGYTWLGRGYAFDIKHLKELMKKAIQHRGAALLDILQPCPTYNDIHDKEWYSEPKVQATGMPRIYKLESDAAWDPVVHDPADRDEIVRKQAQCIGKTMEWGEKIPIGVYYEIQKPTYEDRVAHRSPAYPAKNPANEVYWDAAGRPTASIAKVMDGMRVL